MTIKHTIHELLNKAGVCNDSVYVVWDGNPAPVYVGMAGSQSVGGRLAHHISHYLDNPHKPSKFSNYLFSNYPAFFQWQVEIYTVNEVNLLLKKHNYNNVANCVSCAERELYDYFDGQKLTPSHNVHRPRKHRSCKC